MKLASVLVDMIREGKRLRPLSEPAINTLVESMRIVGLLQPIVIHRPGGMSPHLVAGAHRLEAARRLKWETIQTVEMPSATELEVQLREIDENLIRAELTPAERALFIGRKKQIYELMFPETKAGKGNLHPKNRRQLGDDKPKDRFTKETAKQTGRGERAVQRDAQRAKAIPQIEEVVGTSLDNGADLDRLARMTAKEQHDAIEQAKDGVKPQLRPTPLAMEEHEYSFAIRKGRKWFDGLTEQERRTFVRWLDTAYDIDELLG